MTLAFLLNCIGWYATGRAVMTLILLPNQDKSILFWSGIAAVAFLSINLLP